MKSDERLTVYVGVCLKHLDVGKFAVRITREAGRCSIRNSKGRCEELSIQLNEVVARPPPLSCQCPECKCATARSCYADCGCGCCRYYFGEADDGKEMPVVAFNEVRR